MEAASLTERFHRARGDGRRVVLEGFHPLKHAMRFGAPLRQVVTGDRDALAGLAAELAPDLVERIVEVAEEVPADLFEALAPRAPETGVIAIAERPRWTARDVLAVAVDPRGRRKNASDGRKNASDGRESAPVVLLDNPVHLGNVGAVIRVAAASGAEGVLCSGRHDPWNPEAVRGGAGLQFALPVARVDRAAEALDDAACSGRPVVALDPRGEPLRLGVLPPAALLVFGTERAGLDPEIERRADRRLSVPMRAGVSSLNLATAVAVVLYAWRLSVGERQGDPG